MAVALAIAAVQAAWVATCQRIERERGSGRLSVAVEQRDAPAHEIAVQGVDGSIQRISASSGQFQLLHFWATWCPPCREELPGLFEVARRDSARLRVWAISADPGWDAIRSFLGGSVPEWVVRDSTGARAYEVTGLPDTYLVDPQGRIRARFSGAQNWTSGRMDEVLRRLMDS